MAAHLVAAERALGDEDADRAYEHAKVARRFAARIGVVREAVGVAAYRAGHYAEALSDLRAARRLTGSDAYLPVMADCERGLGRPERALDLVRAPEAAKLDRAGRVELAIVESGARRDLGQHDAAVITLQRLPELRDQTPQPWSARLTFAYADALAEAGHPDAAADWFERAMTFDEDGETDAAERYAELTGSVIEDLEEDEDDLDAVTGEEDDEDGLDLDLDLDLIIDKDDEDDEDDDREVSGAAESEPAEDENEDEAGPEASESAADAGDVVEILDVAEVDEIAGEPEAAQSADPVDPVVKDVEIAADAVGEPVASPSGMVPAFIEPDFGVPADSHGDLDDADGKPDERPGGDTDGVGGRDKG
ncbi:hypothetical protein ABGB17_32010 [Sphaerisporangium sp. B11E5]|uniref:hypothetical protein n=1 Tax=Sphaerisporangium sp. B11E5 TaxID=3153563 RepID=UPI00325F40E6